jgi:hypothetical protein
MFQALVLVPTQTNKQMECFRFGFDFPEIQKKAVMMSKTVAVTIPPRRRIRRRYVHKPRRPVPVPPPVPLKKYTPPPSFSIELYNLFEILDV